MGIKAIAEPYVRLENIVKRVCLLIALNGGYLNVHSGKVHALWGENGAGKSTLIKVMFRVHALSNRTIYVEGKPTVFNSPYDAAVARIGAVYQELAIKPPVSVNRIFFRSASYIKTCAVWA